MLSVMAVTLSRRHFATRDDMRACAASFLGLAISTVAEWARRLARAGARESGRRRAGKEARS